MTSGAAFVAILVLGCAEGLSAQQPGAANPHGQTDRVDDCLACHTVEAWSPLRDDPTFNHNVTGFPLLQAHQDLGCRTCHDDLQFDRFPSHECDLCHVDVHEGQLGTSCEGCHAPTQFSDVRGEEIHASTTFPLDGAHLLLACETCHADDSGGAFAPVVSECVACHENDYATTLSIDHVSFGFATTCTDCHSTLGWGGAYFAHADVAGFVLRGAHARLRCENCHIVPGLTPIYQPVNDTDCFACHRTDYEAQHGGDGFPITCLDCHDQENWDNASFADHDNAYFPIFSGRHAGEWDGCNTCHTTGFATFSCFGCHEHDQSRTDSRHREVRGYAYDSELCLSCHPNGRGED